MRDTRSTFKLGIAFENWGGIGDRYIHSFGAIGKSTWMADFQHFWLQARAEGFAGELGDYCFELQAAEASKFATGDNVQINYAYHLDATRYARFLRALSEPAGVKRVEGKIAQVEQDPRDRLHPGAGARIRRADRGRPVHRLHRLSRAADRADAGDRL